MLVTYLGNKTEMYAHGYDFSDGPVNIPDTDKLGTRKFLGNRYFHCDHVKNYVAPKFYVYEIQNIRLPNDDMGNAQFRKIRGSSKGKGFASLDTAELWVKMNGKLEQTHYVKKSNEGIKDVSNTDEDILNGITLGIFKKKEDGEPYARANKFFTGTDEEELKTKALAWMEEEGINPDERLIMVK